MILRKVSNSFLPQILLIFLLLINATASHSQVNGCNDPTANNYNPSATTNDGSCTYNPVSYAPPVLVDPISAILNESSGLQMAGNFLWSFNDGGGAAAIYRIDTLSNAILQTVNISGATNVDWEDIAFDGTYFYVGDFGSNANGARTDLKIYKFPLSAIPADYVSNPIVSIPAEAINFTYSDQPTPIIADSANHTRYDCEAMIVDKGKIHLFTKNWIDTTTTHYIINSLEAGTYVATPLETLATGYLITGADKAPGQEIVALLGYQTSLPGNHFLHLLTDYSNGNYFNGNKRKINLPDASIMGQAEGITFRNDTYGYISNEKLVRTMGPFTLTVNQRLRSFNTIDFIPAYVLPLGLNDFNVVDTNGRDKITWQFDKAVKKLNIEYSRDGINFSTIKTYDNSISNVFYYKPLNSDVNYYRLAWQANTGALQHSKIIIIKSNNDNTISNFLLKRNGELTFTLNGNSAAKLFSFKLVNTDGRILSQIKERLFSTGVNKIFVAQTNILNQFVYLNIWSDNQKKTLLIQVKN